MANKIAAQPTEDREVEGASNVGDWLSTREAAVKLSCSLSQTDHQKDLQHLQ